MNDMKEFEIIFAIVQRAQRMGITVGTHVTQMMDMDNAHKQFSLNLIDMLKADDANFAHDFIGIQRNINRLTGTVENCFVPRYARS